MQTEMEYLVKVVMMIQVQVGVAGIEMQPDTLVRKSNVSLGNTGDWINSAGMTENSSEWHVLEQNGGQLRITFSRIHPVRIN